MFDFSGSSQEPFQPRGKGRFAVKALFVLGGWKLQRGRGVRLRS
jgi:hypothetical protein